MVVLTYALSPGLPDGLSFNQTTRIISGTPSVTIGATAVQLDLRQMKMATWQS